MPELVDDKYLIVYRAVGELLEYNIWFQPEFYDKAVEECKYLKGIPEVYEEVDLYQIKKLL